MKFRHIVLFGIVASIMAYLNNTLEEEKTDDKQESILDELKELIDNKFEDIDIEKKLEEIKEKAPEQLKEASETVKDVTDNLIEQLLKISHQQLLKNLTAMNVKMKKRAKLSKNQF